MAKPIDKLMSLSAECTYTHNRIRLRRRRRLRRVFPLARRRLYFFAFSRRRSKLHPKTIKRALAMLKGTDQACMETDV